MDENVTAKKEDLTEGIPEVKKENKKAKTGKKNPEVAALETQVCELSSKLEELTDRHQRMLAEYANFKRRTEIEKGQIGSFCKAEILKGLIPALDSLDAAVKTTECSDEKVAEGLNLTIKQVMEILSAQGLEIVDPLNQPFDPDLHNAIAREDSDDVDGGEIVSEVYQKGYKCENRVLRPAMVKVAN